MFDDDAIDIDHVNDLAAVENAQEHLLAMLVNGYLHTTSAVYAVEVRLGFDPADPLAATLTFPTAGADPTTWVLAVETLSAGLLARTGQHGGALVWPVAGEQFCFVKTGLGPVVQLDWDDVATFCDAAAMLVNPIQERALVRDGLAEVLAGILNGT